MYIYKRSNCFELNHLDNNQLKTSAFVAIIKDNSKVSLIYASLTRTSSALSASLCVTSFLAGTEGSSVAELLSTIRK